MKFQNDGWSWRRAPRRCNTSASPELARIASRRRGLATHVVTPPCQRTTVARPPLSLSGKLGSSLILSIQLSSFVPSSLTSCLSLTPSGYGACCLCWARAPSGSATRHRFMPTDRRSFVACQKPSSSSSSCLQPLPSLHLAFSPSHLSFLLSPSPSNPPSSRTLNFLFRKFKVRDLTLFV